MSSDMTMPSHVPNGMVFDIQRCSVHDGPGIRTTVFLKGCNLGCLWCHNPESQSGVPEIQVFPEKCIACGRCAAVCEAGALCLENGKLHFDRARCGRCGRCAAACFAGARALIGRRMTVAEVMETVRRDRVFYARSSGGVTFSGGEPLLQLEFLLALLTECRALGLHAAVDTAGDVPYENLRGVAKLADLILYDVKAMDDTVHRRATGVGNARILDNLKRIADGSIDIHIRIPVVPTVNDTLENMAATAAMLSPLQGIRLVELLPFHKLGESKYSSLGLICGDDGFGVLPKGRTAELARIFEDHGIPAKAY